MKYRILLLLLIPGTAILIGFIRELLGIEVVPSIMVALYMINAVLIYECAMRAGKEIREEKEDRDVLEIDENGNVVRKDRSC